MKAMRAIKPDEYERPSFGELIGRLANESGQLVRAEIALAKREMGDKVQKSTEGAKFFAAGAVFGLAALFCLCAFLIFALGAWLPLWAAAGIVTLAFGIGTFIAVRMGIERWRRINLKPEQTIETLEEDKKWIKKLDFPG
jgi:pilus assembly protein TadC